MNAPQSFFDSLSSTWDALLTERDFKAVQRLMDATQIHPNDSIWDVGAGTGVLIPALLERGITRYLAIEPSRGMAQRLLDKFPMTPIASVSFEDLEGPPQSVDKILIFNSFPHFTDFDRVMKKAYRSLRPHGLLAICHSMNREELNRMHAEVGEVVENDILPSQNAMYSLFHQTGFQSITIDDSDWYLATGVR